MSERTFPGHSDRHELHGITLVVDTAGPEIYIGRCDDITEREVVLLDVDVHRDGDDGRSKREWVDRAAQVGTWPRHAMVSLPRGQVASIRRLGDL